MDAQDLGFLRQAIGLAAENVRSGRGGPFGAVVVRDGDVVGTGVNRVTSTPDPTAHAEMEAIRAACRVLGTFSLAGCTIYSSCEPCPMCLAAIYWARLDRLVFATGREDAAQAGFDDRFFYEQVALAPEDRALPCERGLEEEGLAPFRLWVEKRDRVEY